MMRIHTLLALWLLATCCKCRARLHEGPSDVEKPRTLQEAIELDKVGNNGEPASLFPLKLCQGDCDEDGECSEGLVCFERDAYEAVPGCIGGDGIAARTDYCIQDPIINLSETPSIYPTTSSAPTTSLAPSPRPSAPPTNAPTPTVVALGPFQLRLYWTRRSCWTQSGNEVSQCNREFKWCMQCEGHQCNVGDILWVETCRDDAPTQQLFQWLPLPFVGMEVQVARSQLRPQEEYGQLQMQQKNGDWLCLQRDFRLGDQNHTLQECNADLEEQWYRGFEEDGAFELEANTPDKVLSNCLTMPHHPRVYEEIIHASCQQSRKDRTSKWKALWPDADKARRKYDFNERQYYRLGRARTSPRCSEDRRCGMCQGNCENDDECNGSLKCFKRRSSNRIETPPGCYGDGVPNMDYCYAKRGN